MPILRLDPAPPVDPGLLPNDVNEHWLRDPRSGRMRPRSPARADEEPEQRRTAPQPSAERGATASTALALYAGTATHTGTSASRALVVNAAAVAAAEATAAAQHVKGSSSAAEMAAFTAAFNKARPEKLFQRPAAVPQPPAQPQTADAAAPSPAVNAPAAPPAVPEATAEVDTATDYQGRGFMHYSEIMNPVRSSASATIPSRLVHVFKGHTGAVHAVEWLPQTAHLMLSCDLNGEVMLWDVLSHRRRVGVYRGHSSGVRSITFAGDGLKFSSAGLDGVVREWDTETGAVRNTLRYKNAVVGAHTYHPSAQRTHTLIAGAGKLIVQWDLRASTSKVVREYDAHNAPVMHVGFLGDGHHFGSSSEDKTFRTWDIDASITVQDFADAAMHAVPHFTCRPRDGMIAAQSLDNRVNFFAPLHIQGKYRLLKDKACVGHNVSGSSCRVAFSADGKYVSSGDIGGELHVWDAATCEHVKKFRAHGKTLNAHLWHPRDLSRLVTAGWDGTIKMFAQA
jgi:hypothetical protein